MKPISDKLSYSNKSPEYRPYCRARTTAFKATFSFVPLRPLYLQLRSLVSSTLEEALVRQTYTPAGNVMILMKPYAVNLASFPSGAIYMLPLVDRE